MPNRLNFFGCALVFTWVLGLGMIAVCTGAHAAPFHDADWVSMSPVAGAGGPVHAMAKDDAGRLYIGGSFTAAGGVLAENVARWDGSTWAPLGAGLNGRVNALVFSGGVLYAGGEFTLAGGMAASNLAQWNGAAWQAVGGGVDDEVHALTIFNGALHAGGEFTMAGGVAASRIARWNGSAWAALGGGVGDDTGSRASNTHSVVYALAADGGSLYVGGYFLTANGPMPHDPGVVVARCMARWDGTEWHSLNADIERPVRALVVHEGQVYAAGDFNTVGEPGTVKIARWDGAEWSGVGGGGFNVSVRSLAVLGGKLYAGGYFDLVGSMEATGVACWDGVAWAAVGGGGLYNAGEYAVAHALLPLGGELMVGGIFQAAGGVAAAHVARWSGTAWAATGTGINGSVRALARAANGDMYVGGSFTAAGGQQVNHVARWDGSQWHPLGTGTDGTVTALAMNGTDLFAAGRFTLAGGVVVKGIAKWDGVAWSALGGGITGQVRTLAVVGGHVYAGGEITAAGGVEARGIARWDGTAWSALGSGLARVAVTGSCSALAVAGDMLYATGSFSSAGGVAANNIARWDGAQWAALGGGVHQGGRAVACANGQVYSLGDTQITRWDGTRWTVLATDLYGSIFALAASGDHLYVVGLALASGGPVECSIAHWDGSTWSPLGSGGNHVVYALLTAGPVLYAAGDFTMMGSTVSAHVARAPITPGITSHQAWRATHFGTSANSGDAADDADPDKDGVPNLLEWACGRHPQVVSPALVPEGLAMDGGDRLEFVYPRDVLAFHTGTTYTVEWSDTPAADAAVWSRSGVTEAVLSESGGVQQVKATLPAGTTGRRFVRLKVAQAP